MTLENLYKVKESLQELIADPEIDFGPSYELAKKRKQEALKIVNQEIKWMKAHGAKL
jgi:hypothetical protein